MDDMQEVLYRTFLEEVSELSRKLEAALLDLESSPDDPEPLGKVFRAMHTIKGNSAIFGLDRVSDFTHEVESVYELVRSGERKVDKALIDLTLAAKDMVLAMIGEPAGGDAGREGTLLASFRAWVSRGGTRAAADGPATDEAEPGGEGTAYRIHFDVPADFYRLGYDTRLVTEELARLGACRMIAHTDRVSSLADPPAGPRCLSWEVILSTRQGLDAVRSVFLPYRDHFEPRIEEIQLEGARGESRGRRLGEILVERGDLSAGDLERVVGSQTRLGEALVARHLVSPTQVEAALAEQQVLKSLREEARAGEQAGASIRVASPKLDELVNLVGELITAQARLSQTAARRGNADFTSIAEEVERLAWKLRESAFGMRMVPIGTMFRGFQRLVRDVAGETGKQVLLVTEGGETELDKTMIEKMHAPLVHLIRNCIDHGIEPPDQRERSGKQRQGTLTLSAGQSGSDVVVAIRDDGAGFDFAAIRARGIERGLIFPGVEPPPRELAMLPFLPGFSTARELTTISGRGVGLDVVKKSVEELQGKVEVDSVPGQGTLFTITLPLTLAIIEGLQVAVGEERFIVPLSLVEECVELNGEDARSSPGRLIWIRNQTVPYIRLRERFAVAGQPPPIEQVVVVRVDGRPVGLAVDQVVGEYQTVIKSLGKAYRDVEGVSGATIMGDGSLALILDVIQVVRTEEMRGVTAGTP